MAVRVASAVVRAWTRAYTAGMPPLHRDARRAEIESDLWECCHDPAMPLGGVTAAQIIARLVLGIPDDLHWCVTQRRSPRVVAVGAAVVALTVVALWAYSEYLGAQLLPIPPPSPLGFVSERPRLPPPPPPPPPPRPSGL
jgi:hypothetical protein